MVDNMDPRDPAELSTLDEFLRDEDILEEVTAVAIKRVIAIALRQAMRDKSVTKVMMAEKMQTSRRQLDRILDPEEHNITLDTLARAASSVGRKLKVELV